MGSPLKSSLKFTCTAISSGTAAVARENLEPAVFRARGGDGRRPARFPAALPLFLPKAPAAAGTPPRLRVLRLQRPLFTCLFSSLTRCGARLCLRSHDKGRAPSRRRNVAECESTRARATCLFPQSPPWLLPL
ncbi:hypothetical protein SKAU_G00158080 [Synaphobranchus kaupii]|uniref:Uncharacterized protein n=1 Tax=Synaphobranchus kaupii TaxID=118154 RepID=A0A9Q1IZ43_SYNKA|nr:hypothetical protein SKAU_G00158080 [Synaphobranchus kaupii]